MKNKIITLAALSFSLLFFTGCINEDEVAEELLYGGRKGSGPSVNLTLTRVNGWYLNNGNVLYGLDITVQNPNSEMISGIEIKMKDVNPSGMVADYSSSHDRYIASISASGSGRPDGYWCFDCDTSFEVYIGHFYVTVYSYVFGGQNLEVTFDVEFTMNGRKHEVRLKRNFTTIYNPVMLLKDDMLPDLPCDINF